MYPSHPDKLNARRRMNGMDVFVIDTTSEMMCGRLDLTGLLEEHHVTLVCPTLICGSSVELRVRSPPSDQQSCIHMFEVESYTVDCPRGHRLRVSDGNCVPCPVNTYSAGGETTQCTSCGPGITTLLVKGAISGVCAMSGRISYRP
jgi:hypothetical protein